MFNGNSLIAFTLTIGVLGAYAQTGKRSVVLPQSEAKSLLRGGMIPKTALTETWDPSQSEISLLEANLNQVATLSQRKSSYQRIEHPQNYFHQYLGLSQGHRKFIYVNAFCAELDSEPPPIWRSKLIVIDDGGSCVWQALYDMSANKFIRLSVNGVG